MTIEVFRKEISDLKLKSEKQSLDNRKIFNELCKKFIETNKKFNINDFVLNGKTLYIVKDIKVCEEQTIRYYCCECELIDSIVYEYDYLNEFIDKELVLKKGV